MFCTNRGYGFRFRRFAAPRNDGDLRPSRGLLRRGQVAKTLHRRAHQEAIAFLDDALDIALLDVGMTDHDIVLLAGVDDALHPLEYDLVLVLARIAELLRQEIGRAHV